MIIVTTSFANIIYLFRELAHLLVRHYHDDVHIVELLNKAVGRSGVLFLELIERMEGSSRDTSTDGDISFC